MEEKKYKTTLILGNGFDLSLKLKTSYENFHEYLVSKGFYEKHNSSELICQTKANITNYWYDFEQVIKDYALFSKVSLLYRKLSCLKEELSKFPYKLDRVLISSMITGDIQDLFKEYDLFYVEKLLDKIDNGDLSEVMGL